MSTENILWTYSALSTTCGHSYNPYPSADINPLPLDKSYKGNTQTMVKGGRKLLGLKYYCNGEHFDIQALVRLILEYEVVSHRHISRILELDGLDEFETRAILLKLERNRSVYTSSTLTGETTHEKYFSVDFSCPSSMARKIDKCLWVLLDYIFDVDYHYAGNRLNSENGPAVVFGKGDRHYEIYYVRAGDEAFFNMVLESYCKELIYKTNLAKANGWTDDDTTNSLFCVKRFIVIDEKEQIPLLKVPNLAAYCMVPDSGTVLQIQNK